MSTLQSLRKRLQSTKNILHITQAMEVVAGVRFRKLMSRMEHFRFYTKKLLESVERLKSVTDNQSHPLFDKRPVSRIGVIIVAGDKGLCGSYNENIFKASEKFLSAFSSDQLELILVGNKIIDHFKKSKWKSIKNIPEFARQLTENNVRGWSQELSQLFLQQAYDELWIVYTHYKNVLSRETYVEKILPLENKPVQKEANPIDFIFEPNAEDIYQHMIPYSFYAKIQSILFDSYASELSSRIVTMKAATKNAEDMIEKLTLIKNKNRQAGITTEILEIIAGTEGLK